MRLVPADPAARYHGSGGGGVEAGVPEADTPDGQSYGRRLGGGWAGGRV